jgi:glycosyltransferase involved in cell wall biosynthesis
VIPLGVDEAAPIAPGIEDALRIETSAPHGTTILGIVGSLTARKGHRILIESLSILHRQQVVSGSELRLWIIGDGEDRTRLEDLVQARGLGEVIRFLGTRPDAPSLMRLLDLLIVPSLIETTVRDSRGDGGRSPVSLLEYWDPEMVVDGDRTRRPERSGVAGDGAGRWQIRHAGKNGRLGRKRYSRCSQRNEWRPSRRQPIRPRASREQDHRALARREDHDPPSGQQVPLPKGGAEGTT